MLSIIQIMPIVLVQETSHIYVEKTFILASQQISFGRRVPYSHKNPLSLTIHHRRVFFLDIVRR